MTFNYLLISLFVFAILQTTTAEKCEKFEGKIQDRKIVLSTPEICSCYEAESAGPMAPAAAAAEKTCDVPSIRKVDGTVSIDLEDLCGKCKSVSSESDGHAAEASSSETSSESAADLKTGTIMSPPITPDSTKGAPSESDGHGAEASSSVTSPERAADPKTDTIVSAAPTSNGTKGVSSESDGHAAEVSSSVTFLEGAADPKTVTIVSPSTTSNGTKGVSSESDGHAAAASSSETSPGSAADRKTDTIVSPPTTSNGTKGATEKTETRVETTSEVSTSITSTYSTSISENVTVVTPSMPEKSIKSTTVKKEDDERGSVAHLTTDKSAKSVDNKYSGVSVFLFFLFGAIIGVVLVFAAKYVRNRYKSRSYDTDEAAAQP